MSGLFGKAISDANFSVTMSRDGPRTFKKESNQSGSDQEQRGSYRGGYRGRNSRGRSRGRGRGGGNWRGARGSYRGRGRSQSGGGAGPRTYLDEDDESMEDDGDSVTSHSSRYNPYGSRPSSRRGFRRDDDTSGKSDVKSRLGHVSQYNQNQSSWYKVTIVKGKMHDKEWLIKRLQNSCEEAFQPVDFHYMGDSAMFFVESKAAAEALKRTSHQITVKNGSKIIISVRQSDPPRSTTSGAGTSHTNVNPETLEALKECLSNRYDSGTKLMNLSDLYNDQVLKSKNVQGHIYKHFIAAGILKIIGEHCKDMEGLDLSDNRLYNLDSLKNIASQAPGIKYLKLANNQLKSIDELDKFKGLTEIQTLDLSGNPLCDKFEADIPYVGAVRIRFPKVTMLDGKPHKPPIGFEIAASTALPKVQGSYFNDGPIKDIVLPFIEQYFKFFDAGDRQPLLEAYHDQAMFSLCTNTGVIANREKGPHSFGKDKGPRGPSLGDYMKMSRNMLRRKEADQRASLIKTNRLSVVAMLNELPPTTHDLSTFVIDIYFAMPRCLSFSIRGLFLEAKKTLRSFTRVFVVVPGGNDGKGLRIINDQLHIRSPTLSQIQNFHKQNSTSQTDQQTPSIPPSTSSTPAPNAADQQRMVSQFSIDSKMNTEWSFRCLSENNWDYQKAGAVFTDLNEKGKIPSDAFIST